VETLALALRESAAALERPDGRAAEVQSNVPGSRQDCLNVHLRRHDSYFNALYLYAGLAGLQALLLSRKGPQQRKWANTPAGKGGVRRKESGKARGTFSKDGIKTTFLQGRSEDATR